MADYGRISKAIVKAIADALRYCNGNEAQYTPGQMPNAVRLLKKRLMQKTITRNGVYIPPSNYDGFDRVTVNVEGGGGDAVLVEKSITANGVYDPGDDSADGYSSVSVAVPGPNLQSKTATQNGQVTPDTGYDGLSAVDVAVPNTYSAADNGKVVSGGALVAQTERTVNANGTYDTTENNSVVVSLQNIYGSGDAGKVVNPDGTGLVSQRSETYNSKDHAGTHDTTYIGQVTIVGPQLSQLEVTQNGTYTPGGAAEGFSRVDVNVQTHDAVLQQRTILQNGTVTPDSGYDGFSQVEVAVPNTYSTADNGKVVSNGALVAQTARAAAITENGTFDTTENNSVTVAVPGRTLIAKRITENGIYLATDDSADGYYNVDVFVQPNLKTKLITANGVYQAESDNADGYSAVQVNVPIPTPSLQSKTATANGTVTPDIGYDGLSQVDVNVQPNLQAKTVRQNGNVAPDSGYDGLSSVSVNVSNSYTAQDEDKVVHNGALASQSSLSITQNGTYDTTLKNSVTVEVSGGGNVGDVAVTTGGETLRIIPSKTSVHNSWGVIGDLLTNDLISSLEMPNLLTLQNESVYNSQALVSASFPVCTYISDLTSWPNMETLSAPLCQTIMNCSQTALQNANFPACTHLANATFYQCESLLSANFPNLATIETHSGRAVTFQECTRLETAEFSTALSFPAYMFYGVLTPETGKTFRLYLRGSTMGTCSEDVFGSPSSLTRESESASVGGCGCGCGCGCGEGGGGAIAGLEIYVPSALLNDFKTTWANGVFADNIFPLPDENENA